MAELNTYGDLKRVIKSISLKQKGEKIVSQGKEFVVDQLLGLIPGASNAKTTFDFIKAAFKKPDTKKTNTWLDKLDIDDEMSAIVDDTVENGFMQAMSASIEAEPDDKPLEPDFNMNAKMINYLKEKYGGRSITGIKESIGINEYIKQMVREMLDEESTSGDAGAYLTPKAFAKKGQGKNAATKAAEKQGFKVAPEGMPSDSKVKDYKAIWGKKKKYKIYTSENMNELEMKKGKRFIPPTFPFNEKLLEPFELSKTKEPVRLFKLVSKGEEYILLASPFVKNALESIERGRGSLEKDRQASFNYTANLANYLKDNLNQMARVAIKKYLQNAKPGPGGYFPINLTVTKGKNGELLIKNPVFDTSSDIASPKYESIQDIIKQELINEATYSKFKKDISYRSKTEMLHKGIKEVKRKLAEIDRIVEYTSRMKQELSEGEEGIKYWKATVNNVTQISEMVNTLNEKIKNLYQ